MSAYVDLPALLRIAATSLIGGVVVVMAFTGIVIGIDAHTETGVARRSTATAVVLITAGVLVCTLAVAAGLYAMLQK